MASDYFQQAYCDDRLLQAHGFSHWPDANELARCLFDLEEALTIACAALNLELRKDARGRWQATPIAKEDADGCPAR
jgi:hypothetical protein